eukprot:1140532-Pelagomonas_calceolata.AAC.10
MHPFQQDSSLSYGACLFNLKTSQVLLRGPAHLKLQRICQIYIPPSLGRGRFVAVPTAWACKWTGKFYAVLD